MSKKKKKKKSKKCDNNFARAPFEDYKLPPCVDYLGAKNPFVKNGELVYKNYNRLYCFLTYNYTNGTEGNYNTANPATYVTALTSNMQIETYCLLIGVYINEVQKGNIEFDESIPIHADENADTFIKTIIENEENNEYNIEKSFVPSLTYAISNSNAIVPFFIGKIEISMTNFYIMIMLSRCGSDYGMMFSDNACVTNDFINNILADMNTIFNECNCNVD